MNPTISLPRQHASSAHIYGSPPTSTRGSTENLRLPRFFKQLFKFPQMDFEMAVWEMTTLLFAPKKVFRSMMYHKQTKNTWHRPDPSFTYLLAFFMLLTGLAWGIATTSSASAILRLALLYVFAHFLLSSLLIATGSYLLVGKLLGPGVAGLPGRRRARGLFARPERAGGGGGGGEDREEGLEFGYCFDVSIRAFFPVWVLLYVVQFVLWTVISRGYWLSLFVGNSVYLAAAGYYFVVTFLGYNNLPFLHHTQFILLPLVGLGLCYVVSLFGFNVPLHVAPLLVLGGRG